MTIGEKIAAARKALGREWTQQKLTDELRKRGHKIKRSWIAGVEKNRFNVHQEYLYSLAAILKKPSGYFVPDEQVPDVEQESYTERVSYIPVRGSVSASSFDITEDEPYPERVAVPFESKNCFAIKVSGNCMAPTFYDGEYVIVDPDRQPLNGKVVLAFIDNEWTLKRFFKTNDHIELRPDNPANKTIRTTSNKMIIRGVVVFSCRKH